MFTFRLPKPGHFGTALATVSIGPLGPANFLGGASPLTANNTTTFYLPALGRKARFLALIATTNTVPADADGTILATCQKYSATALAQVAVTGNVDLEALTTKQATSTGPLAGASDATLTFQAADGVEVNVVNNSAAIDTQPAGLSFTAVFELLN